MFKECPNNVTIGGWIAGAPTRIHFPTRQGGITHYLYGKIVCLYRAEEGFSPTSWRVAFVPWIIKKLATADHFSTLAKGDSVILEGHLEYGRVADPTKGETWGDPGSVEVKVMQRVCVRKMIRVPRGRSKEESEKWVDTLIESANKPIVKRSALDKMIREWNMRSQQRG